MNYSKHDRTKYFKVWTTYQTSLYLFLAVNLAAVVLSFVGATLYYKLHFQSTTLVLYAQTMGTVSAILMIVQWTPQVSPCHYCLFL
jgi:hypothetical protein